MLTRVAAITCALLIAAPADAQIIEESNPAMGQPELEGSRPLWFNAASIPLPDGNPEFAMATNAPSPIPMGTPTWLAIYLSPSKSLVKPPNRWNYCFDERPLLPPLGGLHKVIFIFGGWTDGAGAGRVISMPLGVLPEGLSIRINTVGIKLGEFPCVFATDGVTLNT